MISKEGSSMRIAPLIFLVLTAIRPAVSPADEVVSTILIHGLRHVDRRLLLNDLGLHEGDRVAEGLARRLKSRAEELHYLRDFEVDLLSLEDGLHLTLRVHERPRFRLMPLIGTLADGDLVGGMRMRSYSLMRRGESWDATLLAGSMAIVDLEMSGLEIAGPLSLALDLRFEDWESPFLAADQRDWHYLAGLGLRLPRAGRLTLLGGVEHQSTRPYRGLPENEGEDRQALFTGRLRQPTGLAGIALVARGALRKPVGGEPYYWGEAGLDQVIRPGRWRFRARLLQGGASWGSPAFARPFLSDWSWFHAYEAGALETRSFLFAGLRGDLGLFGLPMKMARRGPEVSAPVSAFFLLSAARHSLDAGAGHSYAGEGGLGFALRIPEYDLRLSLGGFVTREEAFKFEILLEDALP